MISRTLRKRKAFDADYDITPMIDVVLLLLIFFMVSARMAPQNVAVLPMAKHGEVAAGKDGVVICVKKGSGDATQVCREDGSLFSDDKEQQYHEIADYIQQSFKSADKSFVLIRGEPTVKNGDMKQIREAISSVLDEGQQILIAVQQ